MTKKHEKIPSMQQVNCISGDTEVLKAEQAPEAAVNQARPNEILHVVKKETDSHDGKPDEDKETVMQDDKENLVQDDKETLVHDDKETLMQESADNDVGVKDDQNDGEESFDSSMDELETEAEDNHQVKVVTVVQGSKETIKNEQKVGTSFS